MSKYGKLNLKSFILIAIFIFIIPFFVVYISSHKSYDDFLVLLSNIFFLEKYGKEYRGYFTYLLGAIITPFFLAVGTSASWLTLAFIIPRSLLKGESKKTKVLACVIVTVGMLLGLYAIPITHYPDFIKDFGLVKREVTKQIEADSYSTYSKREQGGRTYTRHTVYYLYIVGKDGRESFSREFSIKIMQRIAGIGDNNAPIEVMYYRDTLARQDGEQTWYDIKENKTRSDGKNPYILKNE